VTGKLTVSAQLEQPVNVDRATYTLDLAPLGSNAGEDVSMESSSGGVFAVQLGLPLVACNQTAELGVEIVSVDEVKRELDPVAITLFYCRGDANGDERIDAADAAEIAQARGSRLGDAGFNVWADADQDGAITEADLSAVGYFWTVNP
jgi:hypothetical protein